MGIVIRPALGVFQRAMPLVIVFGAYRLYSEAEAMSEQDYSTVTSVVARARKYRIPLAFSRALPADRSDAHGVWLPECRPKITDRVFDHLPGSAFENSEFANMVNAMQRREIYVTGPSSDSSLTASLQAGFFHKRQLHVISGTGTLQLCSTGAGVVSQDHPNPTNCYHHSAISLDTWENTLRVVDHVA